MGRLSKLDDESGIAETLKKTGTHFHQNCYKRVSLIKFLLILILGIFSADYLDAIRNNAELVKLCALRKVLASNSIESAISFKLATLRNMFGEISQEYGAERDKSQQSF